jgi:hypothetical protein
LSAKSPLSVNCTTEIRIWNDTGGTIYAVLQEQATDRRAQLPLATKGGGDEWLQPAFGDSTKCYPVKNNYYVFINPKSGIAKNSFASISVPWWSRRPANALDLYIDWWRGARLFILDDKNALMDSLGKLTAANLVAFAAGSPVVGCTAKSAGNTCLAGELAIYQVPDAAVFGTQTPYQLNEFTFASVSPLENNDTAGGVWLDFNQGYNVSYVDPGLSADRDRAGAAAGPDRLSRHRVECERLQNNPGELHGRGQEPEEPGQLADLQQSGRQGQTDLSQCRHPGAVDRDRVRLLCEPL